MSAESSRLLELRAKTDRQLVSLIQSRLDAGLAQAHCAAFQADAEKTYAEVRALLPWVYGLTRLERRSLESKLAQLRELLDDASDAGLRVTAACS